MIIIKKQFIDYFQQVIMPRVFFLAIFLLAVSVSSYAQNEIESEQKDINNNDKDSIVLNNTTIKQEMDIYFEKSIKDVSADSTKYIPSDKISFRPTEHIHQARTLIKGQKFKTDHWWQRGFISLSSGLYGISDSGNEWQSNNIPVSLSLGYEFNRHSALRLTGTYVQISQRQQLSHLESFGVDLDYIFNLSNYLYGYRPHSSFEVGLVPGVGAVRTSHSGLTTIALKAQLAAHLGVHIGPKMEIYAEPYFGLAMDRINHFTTSSFYDILYGVRVGATIRFRPATIAEEDSTYRFNGKPFLEISQGLSMPFHQGVKGVHTFGTGYQLSLGGWFDPAIGYRLTATWNDGYWGVQHTPGTLVSGINATSERAAWQSVITSSVRAEALINPLGISKALRRNADKRLLGINLGLGAEYGWLIKRGVSNASGGLKSWYYGLTAGVQALFKTSPGSWLFVEPRFTLINYAVPYTNVDGSHAYTDRLGSINIGLRLQRPDKDERALYRTDFRPHLFLSAEIGGVRRIQVQKVLGDQHINADFSLGVGYEWGPLVAVKAQLEYMRYGYNQELQYRVLNIPIQLQYSALWNRVSNIASLRLGYLLNLSNLWLGYDSGRRFNTYIEGGPMVSCNIKEAFTLNNGEIAGGSRLGVLTKDHSALWSFGLYGGFILDFRVNPKWSILLNPEASMYLNKNFWNKEIFGGYDPFVIGVKVGAAYHF